MHPASRHAVCVVLILLGTSCGLARGAAVHKCSSADGRISFQQAPCPARARAEVVRVEGELQGQRRLEAQERQRALRRLAEQQRDAGAARRPATAPVTEPGTTGTPVCPKMYMPIEDIEKGHSPPRPMPLTVLMRRRYEALRLAGCFDPVR